MNIKHLFFTFILVLSVISCTKETGLKLKITNPTDVERSHEVVSVPVETLLANHLDLSGILVAENLSNGLVYPVQLSKGKDSDTTAAALFQPEVGANSTTTVLIRNLKPGEAAPVEEIVCYSRFVPERIDDYAWENDRVAFRVYGPEAQRLTEAGDPGGTLSSGVDCWLKKVDYPIINKWYKKPSQGGTYHEDTGEGLDNYHVGSSRGCGGTMVFDKETGKMYAAKNYIKWDKIEDGIIRGDFKLYYAPYAAGEDTVTETKYISIDKGSNLTRFEIEVKGTDAITVGITLHEKKQEISADATVGWFNFEDKHYFGSELNTAVVVDPKYVTGYEEYIVNQPEKSHLLVHLKPIDGKIIYYSGFFWKESRQFASTQAWKDYLNDFAVQVTKPLEVTIE
ncbi:DUF4861 family protein [Saccharicrinis sp. FJH54]|uniref:DUF4861 family protein n=1 Tax=Saccharicrinis sp. FJH54 TaxID=3344665 RepID=UPI0035D4B245